MTIRGELGAVEAALVPVRESLAVDGYRFAITEASPTRLRISVEAMENACAECLVPEDVFKMIVCGQLDGAYGIDEVDVTLPVRGSS